MPFKKTVRNSSVHLLEAFFFCCTTSKLGYFLKIVKPNQILFEAEGNRPIAHNANEQKRVRRRKSQLSSKTVNTNFKNCRCNAQNKQNEQQQMRNKHQILKDEHQQAYLKNLSVVFITSSLSKWLKIANAKCRQLLTAIVYSQFQRLC